MKKRILFCALACALAAFADNISGLCSTGVTGPCSGGAGTGMLATPGVVDSNWSVSPDGPVVTYYNGAYFANNTSSQWVAPSTQNAATTYTYSTTFNILPAQKPGTANIQGLYWGDNQLLATRLNGNALGLPLFGAADFGGPGTAFSITSGFQSGVNTLEFDLRQQSGSTGFRVQFNSGTVTATPEPGSLAFLGIAGLFVAGYRRVRRG